MTAFVFPGQGAQFVGMGRDMCAEWPEARFVVDTVAEVAGVDLWRLMREGPAEELMMTRHAQLALLACGVAAARVLRSLGVPAPDVVAGHSLGEYTAVQVAGALDLETAARLVSIRGEAMAAAPEGTMAAVLGMDDVVLEDLCRRAPETVVLANRNAPGQAVVSGTPGAVAWIASEAPACGARRVVPLQVSGAFHSPLMTGALAPLSAALDSVAWLPLSCPVVHNVDASANADSSLLPALLGRQLAAGVDWVGCVRTLEKMGVTTCVELGAGRTLSGLIRKIAPGMRVLSAATPDELRAVTANLQAAEVPA
ncbi:MAG: ACP S-malonyltransferase [Candidatus Sericytochromatia bacterium]|nr:ACP S-malonyltransferase [Candidatus Sericytochromatia bacterium]